MFVPCYVLLKSHFSNVIEVLVIGCVLAKRPTTDNGNRIISSVLRVRILYTGSHM